MSEDVRRWMNIESERDIVKALVDDTFTEMECSHDVVDNLLSDDDSETEDKNFLSIPLPSVGTIVQSFQQLKNIAMHNDVDGAIFHLRRARQIFLAAKSKQGSAARQLLISEVLQTQSGINTVVL